MTDDLSGLTALLAVAEKRSFTAAAAELRVTPSAVSQTVRALEERVGVHLLQRTTRSVGLTEAGERFLSRLRPAMQGVREAFDALGELRDRPAGLLRVTTSRLAYQEIIAPQLGDFLAAYPDVSLDLSIDDAFVDIVRDGFDAGIRIGEMIDREMISVPLAGDMRMAIVGSPSYFARHQKPKRPRDLTEHDCINYRRRSKGVVYRWELTENGKDLEIAVDGRLLMNDGDLMIHAAVDGHGLAYVPESAVRGHLAARRLIRVLDAYCVPFPWFHLYYPSRAHLAPKLQAFVETFRWRRARRQT